MKLIMTLTTLLLLSSCDFACKSGTANGKSGFAVPKINEDFAYAKIIEYEKFGSKIPGSPAHKKAGDWIVAELKSFGFTVLEQLAEVKLPDGKKAPLRNIIAQQPGSQKTRIMLSAHWDNRPHADNDSDKKNHSKPVPGVNDGGSGVAVLLSIAKAIHESKVTSDFGIDLAFWDTEDGGTHANPETFCLGSQYWARNPMPENYIAKFGVNFDMIGRKGTILPIEAYSMYRAPDLISKLKKAAVRIGTQDYFSDERIGQVVDDHYYVSQGRGFPMIDLIYMTPDGKFPPEWHTVNDTSEFISRDVMKAIGQTVLEMIYGKDEE